VQQFQPPFNALAYTRYPDMLEHAIKGVQLGSMIGRLPRTARENAAQAAMASIAQEQAKDLQATIRQIQADKTLDAATKTQRIREAILESGFGYGGSGGTFDPMTAAYRLLNMQIQRATNPGLFPSTDTGNPPATNPPAPTPRTTTPAPAPAPAPNEEPEDKSLINQMSYLMPPQQYASLQTGGYPPAATFLQGAQSPSYQLTPAPIGYSYG